MTIPRYGGVGEGYRSALSVRSAANDRASNAAQNSRLRTTSAIVTAASTATSHLGGESGRSVAISGAGAPEAEQSQQPKAQRRTINHSRKLYGSAAEKSSYRRRPGNRSVAAWAASAGDWRRAACASGATCARWSAWMTSRRMAPGPSPPQ